MNARGAIATLRRRAGALRTRGMAHAFLPRSTTFWAPGTLLLALALPVAAAAANDDDDFYRGKTISLIIPIGPGGAYDTYARLVARYLGKELPGNPVIVPRNMPGAGGTIASNHVLTWRRRTAPR
jgi:tripartite-type tricarboxylate transporter receptor subunit TctC